MECYTSTFNVRGEKVIQQWNVTRQHLTLEEKSYSTVDYSTVECYTSTFNVRREKVIQQWNVTRQHFNVRREKVIQQWNVTRHV